MRSSKLFFWCVILMVVLAGCSSISSENKQKNEQMNETTSKPVYDNSFNNYSDDNPIDKAFKNDFKIATATPELNYVSEEYLNAWENEWNNITNEIKKQYQYESDKKLIDTYKTNFEKFVDQAKEVEWLKWSDTSVPPGTGRTWGTGAVMGCNMEQAGLYKSQVLRLIQNYFGPEYQQGYSFIYKGKGAELQKKMQEEKQ